jgi:hypothetical protein
MATLIVHVSGMVTARDAGTLNIIRGRALNVITSCVALPLISGVFHSVVLATCFTLDIRSACGLALQGLAPGTLRLWEIILLLTLLQEQGCRVLLMVGNNQGTTSHGAVCRPVGAKADLEDLDLPDSSVMGTQHSKQRPWQERLSAASTRTRYS